MLPNSMLSGKTQCESFWRFDLRRALVSEQGMQDTLHLVRSAQSRSFTTKNIPYIHVYMFIYIYLVHTYTKHIYIYTYI